MIMQYYYASFHCFVYVCTLWKMLVELVFYKKDLFVCLFVCFVLFCFLFFFGGVGVFLLIRLLKTVSFVHRMTE